MQPSDNDFDKLIRQAGEAHQPAGATPDWDKMQSLLDKHMPEQQDNRRRFFFILLGLLFLLGGSTYFYFRGTNGSERQTSSGQVASTTAATALKTLDSGKGTINNTTGAENNNTSSATISAQTATSNHGSTPVAKNPKRYHQKGKFNSQVGAAAIDETDAPGITQPLPVPVNQDKQELYPTQPGTLPSDSTANHANLAVTIKTPQPDSPVAVQPQIDQPKNEQPTTKKTQVKNVQRGWEFSLLYAPELTTIGFSKFDKPGSNVGLLLGYAFSKKIILQTGIIRSRKNYTAFGDDFKLDYTLPADHSLTKVSGYCMMYEIPLQLKSYIANRKQLAVFYTAGISSYFMESEFYTYRIKTATGAYDKNVSYRSQRNYWLSVGALSVGLAKQLLPHLNIEASPFIKIPFKGMGEGSLKMLGTGINFSLVYRPAATNK